MKTCGWCNESFARGAKLSERQWQAKVFCSQSCGSKARWARERKYMACEQCGEDFHQRRSSSRYCSKRCASVANYPGVSPNARGGLWVGVPDGRAFITLRAGGQYAYARGLMEGHLGRDLKSDEVVHHVNGDPTDDRIENLRVLSRAEHMEVHRHDLRAAA